MFSEARLALGADDFVGDRPVEVYCQALVFQEFDLGEPLVLDGAA